MSRTSSITVDGVSYGVGWNEEGWFAYRDDGVNTRSYCATLDELRQAVADGDWEVSELEDENDDEYARDCGRQFLSCCDDSDYEWCEAEGDDLAELIGRELLDLGGEG